MTSSVKPYNGSLLVTFAIPELTTEFLPAGTAKLHGLIYRASKDVDEDGRDAIWDRANLATPFLPSVAVAFSHLRAAGLLQTIEKPEAANLLQIRPPDKDVLRNVFGKLRAAGRVDRKVAAISHQLAQAMEREIVASQP